MDEEDERAIDDKANPPQAGGAPTGERDRTATWVRRGVMILVGVVVVFVLYKVCQSFLPRWWANRINDQVNGSMTGGTLWGLFYGFVFSSIPLLLLFQVRRKFFKWKAKAVVALIAIALAAPNWLTLWVVAGNTNASHAAERAFDVGSVGFRWATLLGVIAGAGVAVALVAANIRLGQRRKQVKELKEQLRHRKTAKDERSKPDEEG